MITPSKDGESLKRLDTNWATGENLRLQAHGLQLIMMTDREVCVFDPINDKILQLHSNLPDTSGRLTALGGIKGQVFTAYNPNPGNKKQSRTVLHMYKEISYEKQIHYVL
jgi:hypothetical protein